MFQKPGAGHAAETLRVLLAPVLLAGAFGVWGLLGGVTLVVGSLLLKPARA